MLTTHNHNRHTFKKITVIRKNDLAAVTKKALPKPQIIEQKPCLIHMVACKTVGEYKKPRENKKVLFRGSQATEDHGTHSIIVQKEYQLNSRKSGKGGNQKSKTATTE